MEEPSTVWYHGTDAALAAGDALVCGGAVGRHNFDNDDPDPDWQAARTFAKQRVWVTTSAAEAAYYAAHAAVIGGGTARIYQVAPHSCPQRSDVDDGQHCDGATIVAELDTDVTRSAAIAAADAEPDPDWILDAFALDAATV